MRGGNTKVARIRQGPTDLCKPIYSWLFSDKGRRCDPSEIGLCIVPGRGFSGIQWRLVLHPHPHLHPRAPGLI